MSKMPESKNHPQGVSSVRIKIKRKSAPGGTARSYSMKSLCKFLVIPALAAVIGFALAACGNPAGGPPAEPRTVSYSAAGTGGEEYVLEITEAGTTIQIGDSYELKITSGGTTKTSRGTVTAYDENTGVFELSPAQDAAPPITITVAGGDISAIAATTITFTDGNPPEAPPATLTPPARSITITGLSAYSGKWACAHLNADWNGARTAMAVVQITGDSVTFPLKQLGSYGGNNQLTEGQPWTGTGEYYLHLQIDATKENTTHTEENKTEKHFLWTNGGTYSVQTMDQIPKYNINGASSTVDLSKFQDITGMSAN
jgi:hypothetical protein